MELISLENRGLGPDCPPPDRRQEATRVAEAWLPTEHGRFRIVGFRSPADGEEAPADGEATGVNVG